MAKIHPFQHFTTSLVHAPGPAVIFFKLAGICQIARLTQPLCRLVIALSVRRLVQLVLSIEQKTCHAAPIILAILPLMSFHRFSTENAY